MWCTAWLDDRRVFRSPSEAICEERALCSFSKAAVEGVCGTLFSDMRLIAEASVSSLAKEDYSILLTLSRARVAIKLAYFRCLLLGLK